MLKKILCLLTAFAGMSFAMEQPVEEEPSFPRVHSYNGEFPPVEFSRTFRSSAGGPIIVSIQYMSSAGVGNEEIAFKPQWAIFDNDVIQKFDKIAPPPPPNPKFKLRIKKLRDAQQHPQYIQFSIGTTADCFLKINNKPIRFKPQEVCFHEPHMASPDTMHLGFTKEAN